MLNVQREARPFHFISVLKPVYVLIVQIMLAITTLPPQHSLILTIDNVADSSTLL